MGGEPRIIATIPPPTATVQLSDFPSVPPDMALGASIYAQHCTACHGLNGVGDGTLVLSGQVGDPGNFRLAETANRQRPTDWYTTITNGRIERLMPPWRDALTEEERWAVSYYTYTMAYSADALTTGRDLYLVHCLECHDVAGGYDSTSTPVYDLYPSLIGGRAMSLLSDNVVYNIITEGVGDLMPGYADEMTEAERRAVTEYTRSLSLTNTDQMKVFQEEVSAESTPEATADTASVGIVRGTVVNGTAGGTLPADSIAELFVLSGDLQTLVLQTQATVDAAGIYTFADVPLDLTGAYIARVTYREQIYTSAITPGSAIVDNALDLPITVYDETEDPMVIQMTGMVTRVNVIEGSLEVAQVWNLRNISDRAFTTSQISDDGRAISLGFTLPPGSIIVAFEEQGRYLVDQERFAFYDTLPVLPGEDHIVQVRYFIEYDDAGAIIEQALPYAFDGAMRLLIRPTNLRVQSEQLPVLGVETVGDLEFAAYGGALTFAPGDVVGYTLSGRGLPPGAIDASSGVVEANNLPLVIIVGIAVEIIVIGGLFFVYRRRRQRYFATKTPATLSPASPSNLESALMDALVRQIAELDADHEAGRIDDTAWQQQRAALKARLAQGMNA